MQDDDRKIPPLDPEQCLDLVIAAAAHRSHSEAQRKFGELLIDRYFGAVPSRYADDRVASAYLDEMLCAIAWAIRGFSVVRDQLETNWETLRQGRDREAERAKRLDLYSPFSREGHWGRIIGILGGLGFGGFATALLQNWLSTSPLAAVLAGAFLIVIGLFGMELLVDLLRNHRLQNCEERFPQDLLSFWRERSLTGYKTVARHFLIIAMDIRNRYYPSSSLPDEEFDELVERHFAFD